jgi:hypothetical protein
MLKNVAEQLDNEMNLDKVMNDAEYEKLVQAIDEAGGDMEPILGLDKLNLPSNPNMERQKEVLGIKDKSEMDIDAGNV